VTRDNWRIVREVYVTDNKDQALRDIREGVKLSYDYLLGLGLGALMKIGDGMTDADLTLDWMVDNIPWIIGSPEECTRKIKELEEEVGGFGTLLINCRDWVTTDKWNRSLEMFARYVMPQFTQRERLGRRKKMADRALGLS
jgi:limonene 1,2-monooxygenase